MDEKQIISAIALNAVLGHNPRAAHRIIESLGSPAALFSLSTRERADFFGPYSKFEGLLSDEPLLAAEREYKDLSRRRDFGFAVYGQGPYPRVLAECPDAPILLYIRSQCTPQELFDESRPRVAIVGTRDPSDYGIQWAERIVEEFSKCQSKPVIVSGLALGIDICAQQSALRFGLPSIGVSPVGIDSVYPRRHYNFASRLCETPESAIITDFPPDTVPMPFNFLRRNRIIAGLSCATILVESKYKGGGTMTSRLAQGYGRAVFALPGRLDDIRSQGCNTLISEQIAEGISSTEALIHSLGLDGGKKVRRQSVDISEVIRSKLGGRVPEEQVLCAIGICSEVKDHRGISAEELSLKLNLKYSETCQLVYLLESEGILSTDILQRCSINLIFD